ncbi:S8 family serine peptidase [Nonomuraea sp. NPDC049784]|uniref:S8 family serine peptidase n=1 Tax=Nonomuraea sp. NPDC049784 TaxID=3154361 RepID=UPI0033EB9C01
MDLSEPTRGRRLLVAAIALIAVAWPGAAEAEAAPEEQKTYIVQMAADPVATYEGDVAGLATTKPQQGKKIDPGSADVKKYADHLRGRHDAALKKAGGGKKLYDYVYSYGGFAAKLTESQARELRAMPDVVAVTEDKKVTAQTSSTPSFLGLDAQGGLWDQLGGPTGAKGNKGAGDGLVIGVIDSGIWPTSKSFASPDADGKPYDPVRGFNGTCVSGSPDGSWDGGMCNGKLAAARYFNDGWGGDEGVKKELPWEYLSPRDYNGHGTHTSSTAAGNYGVPTTGPAAAFGSISGIAPRARVSTYKALWSTQDGSTANGYYSDLVAAIDQAVADGVDVINYSVSGTSTDFLDPAEAAFLSAAEAGIFVSASAGNSGPTASTVAHPSPWVTTVAAGTHNRSTQGSVTLGNGTKISGASLSTKAGPAPLVDSTAAGLAGVDATRLAQCYAARDNGGKPVLDPAKVKGKIVICDRGITPRVNKSIAVAEAGGIGMILANVDENSLNSDLHSVPTVHIAVKDRQTIKDYAATDGATATIDQATISNDAPAPYVAEFSSRGPLAAGGGDVLKPDLIAPGQDILAAFAPPAANGLEFNFSSGTSMSAPHVAGLAALLKDLHPSWSPMAIKSALMTSGTDVLDGPGTDPSVIFAQGAGHVAPNSAADPGLVYDSGIEDWVAFLCGTTKGVDKEICDKLAGKGYSFDASDMNTPSISIGRLPGTQTVTREVTNVGRSTTTYTASTAGLDGITVEVSPKKLTLRAGETKSFKVTFTRTTAPMNTYQGGQLTWKDKQHTVRVPIIVRPVQETWSANHGVAGGDDSAEQIALDPKGKRVYVSGASYGSSPGVLSPSIVTVAHDAVTGVELWSKSYVGPAGNYDEPEAIEVSPDGSKLFVVGTSAGNETGTDAVTIAYDTATGEEVWTARHTGPGSAFDSGNALTVSPDGKSVYVTGMSTLGPDGKDDYYTIAYDAGTGERTWLTHFAGPGGGTDSATAISVAPDGSKLFVTGQSSGERGTGLCNWGTVAYNAGTGEQLWSAQHDGPAHGMDLPSAMAVAADGKSLFVTGSDVDAATQTDITTIAYDTTTGKQTWVDRYDGPAHGSDNTHDIVVAASGKVYVTGNTDGVDTRTDYTTIAYDPATGARSWVQTYSGQAKSDDIAWDLALTPDGNRVVVSGQSVDDPNRGDDYVTIAYDAANGAQTWLGRYDGEVASRDSAHALAVDATADAGVRIFVTGTSATGGLPPDMLELDFVTAAYFAPWKKP